MLPGIIKIGITKDLSKRLKKANNTSIPIPFVYIFYRESLDCLSVEQMVFNSLSEYRINENKEFFSIDICSAISCINKVCDNISLQYDELRIDRIYND